MFENKYSKVLTAILIVSIILIVGLLGFLSFDVYQKYATKKATAQVLDEFDEKVNNEKNANNELISSNSIESNIQILNNENNSIAIIPVEETSGNTGTSNSNESNSSSKKQTYKGYNVVGKIEIPVIKLAYPILERVTTESIELAVAVMYGPGPNQVGNTVIAGHNYRNGDFFGNNDKLKIGDKIYITDTSGTKIKYNIYNIYETTPDDGDYMVRDTKGKREVSLTTCTDNSKARLVIWAVEE